MDDLVIHDEMISAVNRALNEIKGRLEKVSEIKTPKRYIEKKMGLDYVKFPYMRKMADENYPGWSWTVVSHQITSYKGKPVASVIHGRLRWFEDGLWREGDAVAAHRIQYKKKPKKITITIDAFGQRVKQQDSKLSEQYSPPFVETETFARDDKGKIIMEPSDELVDIGNDIKASNTDAMKKAFNVYLNISDDVYKAHIEDISLSEKEKDTLLTLSKEVGLEDVIRDKIEDSSINKTNYELSIRELERRKKDAGN